MGWLMHREPEGAESGGRMIQTGRQGGREADREAEADTGTGGGWCIAQRVFAGLRLCSGSRGSRGMKEKCRQVRATCTHDPGAFRSKLAEHPLLDQLARRPIDLSFQKGHWRRKKGPCRPWGRRTAVNERHS